jgi:peptidyl-prolyl cis-trans isomerase D
MLQKIGDKLQGSKWLSYVMLGALALVFAAWGAYGIVDFTSHLGNYAAKVGSQEISLERVKTEWQRQEPQYLNLFGGEIPAEQRTRLQSRLLDAMVREEVVRQAATKLGFAVTEAQLRQAYQSEPAFQAEGKFSPQAAMAALAGAGMSPAAYEAAKRLELVRDQVAMVVGISEFLTPAEVARLHALEDEQRELRFALLTPQQFAGSAPVDAAAIDTWYKGHSDQYQTIESARVAYGELTLASVSAGIKVSDAQLSERYEKNRDRFVEPERRQARHILLTVDKPADSDTVKAQADALYKQIQGGGDFAALAKANSKDPISAAKGGELDLSDRNAFVPEFSAALFALKQGEVSAPVKTQFGWHIIKLEAIQSGKSRSLDEVRGELTAEMARELAGERFGERQEQLQQRIERGVGNFDELVKEFGLQPGEVANFVRGGGGGALGSDAKLNEAVFSARAVKEQAVSGPVSLGEDRLVVFRVTEHRPPQAKPLAEVRDSIVAELLRQRGSAAAKAAADAALKRLDGGESLDKVLADLKVKSDAARFVGRVDPGVPVQVLEAAFAAARPQDGKPQRSVIALDEGGVALLAVTASRVPDPEAGALRLRAQRVQREQQRQAQQVTEAYIQSLVNASKVSRNPKAFE